MTRRTILITGALAISTFLLWQRSATLWQRSPTQDRAPSSKRASLEHAGLRVPGDAHQLVTPRRSQEGSHSNPPAQQAPAKGTLGPLTSLSLIRAVQAIQKLNEERDLEALERAIEAILDEWASTPEFAECMLQAFRGSNDLDPGHRIALFLVARSWLAVAFAKGDPDPRSAEAFAYSMIETAYHLGDEKLMEFTMFVLREQDPRAQGPQLLGLPRFAEVVMQLLPTEGTLRTSGLELLEHWALRQGASGVAFLSQLRFRDQQDLRCLAYRGLLEMQPAKHAELLADIATEGPRIVGAAGSVHVDEASVVRTAEVAPVVG